MDYKARALFDAAKLGSNGCGRVDSAVEVCFHRGFGRFKCPFTHGACDFFCAR